MDSGIALDEMGVGGRNAALREATLLGERRPMHIFSILSRNLFGRNHLCEKPSQKRWTMTGAVKKSGQRRKYKGKSSLRSLLEVADY